MLEGLIPVVMPQYCERDVFGFEIINTVSNIGFWIAAFYVYRGEWRVGSRFLVFAMALLVIVGLCSGLFHLRPSLVLLVLDAVPLYVLVLSIAYRALSLMTRITTAIVFIILVIASAVIANAATVDTAIHVAARHGVALIALTAMASWIRRRNRAAGRLLLAGVSFYAVALAAKAFDGAVCAFVPIGSHWLWHLAGAIGAGTALRGIALLEVGHNPQSFPPQQA